MQRWIGKRERARQELSKRLRKREHLQEGRGIHGDQDPLLVLIPIMQLCQTQTRTAIVIGRMSMET